MKPQTVVIDNEFRTLVPPLRADELQGLEADVCGNGLRDALVVWQNNGDLILLDGHNRYDICQRQSLPFDVTPMQFASRDEAMLWIEENSLHRRNLTDDQRAALAFRAAQRRSKLVKSERAKRANDAKYGRSLSENVTDKEKADTRAEASKAQGVSEWKVRNVSDVAKHDKALVDDIISGKVTLREAKRKTRKKARAEKVKETPLPTGTYRVLYADPPWSYGNKGMPEYGHAETHYEAQTIEQLCAMPVRDMVADDAVLFMWVTSPLLADCWPVIEAWGFVYKASFVWDKVRHNFGHYNSVRHELLLVCTRGKCTPDSDKLHDSVQSIEREKKHSKKPEQFRQIIDAMYPPPDAHTDRVELFSRDRVKGWDVWGNEV